ncbi:MAG: sugar ABC transporter ATP-binding protein, partial [Spirochaetes bacterium]
VAFLGPSGCGKTTTLLMIAGIYKPTKGTIHLDKQAVNHLTPRDRNISTVFQSHALYPHMSVFQNISYPMKLKKMARQEIKERVQRVAKMVSIGELLDRKPAQLSGGQQQRVALGRALVKEPELLLFDEPLSNLDARLRLVMRSEIKRLQMELGITSIYVTHDQVEAMTMADRIAVMKDGRLQAFGTPDELYEQPRTLFIAGFIGNPPMNIFQVEVVQENGKYHARREGFDIKIPSGTGSRVAGRGPVMMGIRPESISTSERGIAGDVYVVEPLGREDLIDVRIGDMSIHFLADPSRKIKTRDTLYLNFKLDKLQFFDPETGKSLLWT